MKYSLWILTTALLAGCGAATTKADTDTATSQNVLPAPVSESSTGSDITVTLTGGPNAGTYHASTKEATCSMGLTGDKSFGNQYSETGKGDKDLSSVQLMADNYDEAKKGTSNFNVQISFGSLLSGASYSLNPPANSGTGKLTITESGSGKTATVEGKTKDGVGINAVITCKTVAKMVDGQLKEE